VRRGATVLYEGECLPGPIQIDEPLYPHGPGDIAVDPQVMIPLPEPDVSGKKSYKKTKKILP